MLSLLVQAALYAAVICAVRAAICRLVERTASVPEGDADAQRALLSSAGNLRWLGLAGWLLASSSARLFPEGTAATGVLSIILSFGTILWIWTADFPVKARLANVPGSQFDYFSFSFRWYGMHIVIFSVLAFLLVKLIPKTIECIPAPGNLSALIAWIAAVLFAWLLAASWAKDLLVILSIRLLFPGRAEDRPEIAEMLRRRFEGITARVPEFVVLDSDRAGIYNMLYLGHPLFDRLIHPRIYGGEKALTQDARLTDALSAWAAATIPIRLAWKDDLFLPIFAFAFMIPLALISEEAVRASGVPAAVYLIFVWFAFGMFGHFKATWRHELSLDADALAVSRFGVDPDALADALDAFLARSARLRGESKAGWWARWIAGLTRERIERLRAGAGRPSGFAVSRVLRRKGWRWFALIFLAAFVVSGVRFVQREFFATARDPGLTENL